MQTKKALFTSLALILLISACAGQTAQTVNLKADLDRISLKILSGDFNGDGRTDTLRMVPTQKIQALPLKASLHKGWPDYGESKPPDLSQAGPVALLIAENHPDGQRFHMIYDPNPISILDTEAARDLFIIPQQDRQNPAWSDIGAQAKGDLIVIPTEAGIDTYLFWDGKAYRSFEPMEIP